MKYTSLFKIPLPEGQKIFDNDYKASKFIGVEGHFSDDVLLLTDKRLMQVIKIGGFSFETAYD